MLDSRLGCMRCVCALVLSLAVAGHAKGGLIVYGSHTDEALIPGGSLGDVRLFVELSASGGEAMMTFTNVSIAPETSAVFKRIVLDTVDDDSNQPVLWNGVVLTNTVDVSYSLEPYIVLPGYNPPIPDDLSMIQLEADPGPPVKGIGPGEVLHVQFDTSLSDGADIFSYLAFFDGGDDTAAYSIGMHAISATVLDGESLGGVYIPEPATLSLLALGAMAFLRRRRR